MVVQVVQITLMKIAYLSNSYPEPSESYVGEEIAELRRHGIEVLACSSRGSTAGVSSADADAILPLRMRPSIKAAWLAMTHILVLWEFIARALRGPERLSRKLACLAHTFLGVYFAVLLREQRIRHIHVHHGYFSAWIGMVAARLLNAGYSLTLHGSDLLLSAAFLDTKLQHCRFCLTVSRYNRGYLLSKYPNIDPHKVIVQRTGVDTRLWNQLTPLIESDKPFRILSVGRLHPVKNYGFLILACRGLKDSGVRFRCAIAGDGVEREQLSRLISGLDLDDEISLLGHVPRQQLPNLYAAADVVVLTSMSEGIPITLMEAMAMRKTVLAPDITGIPELVIHGTTGFLYRQNSMEDFLAQLQTIIRGSRSLNKVNRSARNHVARFFNGPANLETFAAEFLSRIHAPSVMASDAPLLDAELHEDPLLQQV